MTTSAALLALTEALAPRPARQLHPGRVHGGSELDRHADALATLAGLFRHVFILPLDGHRAVTKIIERLR